MGTKRPPAKPRKSASTSQNTPPPRRVDPWERQPAESDPAWVAFTRYRDLGPDERSLAKVAEALGKSVKLIERWSRGHSWVLRVSQFDAYTDRMHQQGMARARVRAEERNMAVASAMLGVAASGLQQIALKPDKLKPADIAVLAQTAARLENAALALAGASTGPRGLPAAAGGAGPAGSRAEPHHVDLDALPDEDRRARMIQLQRELDVRLRESDPDVDHSGEPDPDDEVWADG